ncbi:MAG: hypothetical protein M1818_004932 [Claussenomyces sp. TS43310]|nr:MAG: hypothetical protein M1818_004932 [Claussenomyces sp. TS43310]
MTPHSLSTKRLLKYLPPKGMPLNPSGSEIIKFSYARDSIAPYDHIFDTFVKDFKFSEAAQYIEAAMKEKHTITEQGPFRLKLLPSQPGAQEEVDLLLGGGVSGKECYVERKRICMYQDENRGK